MPSLRRAFGASLATLVLCLLATAAHAAGITYSWVGGSSNRWSEQANWNPVGVPGAGDNLAFPAGAMNMATLNDLPAGTVFAMLQFNGGGYRLGGNAIGLTIGVSTGAELFMENVIELPIVAQGDLSLGPATYQGGITLGSHTLRLAGGSGLRFTGPVSGTGQVLSPYLTNPRFSGSHPFAGVIRGSIVLENAELPNASIDQPIEGFMLSGDVKGTGLVGGSVNTTFAMLQSPYAPQVPGMLRVGNLSVAAAGMFSGGMSFRVHGSGPGTGHDQIRVAGTVNIGAMTFVNVDVAPTLAATLGQEFVLVDNQGTSPVSGAFSNLVEGSILVAGSYQFRFTYVGGDGNDIAIVCTLAPNVWKGTVDGRWSEPANWSGGVPVPGSDLIFPPGTTTLSTNNDLPAGIVYRSLRLNGSGYRIAGNGIGITAEVNGGSGFPTNVVDVDIAAGGDLALGGGIYNGAISLGTHSLSLTAVAQFNGPVSGTGAIHVPYLVNPRFAGHHPFAGVIRGGAVLQDATLPNAAMDLPNSGPMISGTLQGHGTLGGPVRTNFVAPGAGTSPGSFAEPPGRLSVGSLTLATGFMSSSLEILINGPGAGTGYDQVRVTQGVDLGTNSFLNVGMNPSYVPGVGQEFVLVDHLGSGAVVGTFNNLPEGAAITLGSYQFRLTYAGGDGNDISLVCTAAPNVWTGAVDGRWSVPGNWSGGVPGPGSDLTFPPGGANVASTNDLPAGTVFRSIRITGTGYRLGGNAIGLTQGVDGAMGGGAAANRLALPITAHGDLTVGGVTFEGPIELGATTLRIGNGGAAFEGPIAGTGTIHAPYLTNPRLRGTHAFAGIIRGGLVLDNASLPNATVGLPTEGPILSATLQGNGTIGGSVTTNSIAPSGAFGFFPPPPGIINVGSVTFATGFMSSSFTARIHGAQPGSGYDQLVAGSGVDLGTNTFLNLQLSPGFVPTSGDTYVIIDNRGSGPVTGTFVGLPEGSEVTLLGVYRFKLSYAGGQGSNDVVLVSMNGKNPTATTLNSSLNPSSPSAPVTFTATVTRTRPSGDPTPSGSVRFWSGTTFTLVPLVDGTATMTVALPSGSHVLRAEYPGDLFNGGSTSPDLVQVVSAQGSTTPGSDVAVEVSTTLPNGGMATIDIQFASVSSGGTTTVTAAASGPTPPSGFQLGDPPVYFDVTTTAAFAGQVTLCFGWAEGQFRNEAAIGLWHFEGGSWVNVTTLLDTAGNTVCGRTTSLSPFALMETKFPFSGFFSPVANLPAFNAVKAGASVPVKFSLGGDRGLSIFAAGYPRSAAVACGASAPGALEETTTAGNSALTYDAASGQYTYVWKTEKAWSGSCRALVVRFTDGTEATAGFDFK